MNEPQTPTRATERYEFTLDEKTGRLFGIVKAPAPPGEDEVPQAAPASPSLRSINEDLKTLGYADLYFPTNSVEQFFKKLQRYDAGKYLLAEKRDAKIKLTIARDKTTARVQTDQAWGGTALTRESIMKEIEKAGIDESTLDNEKLAQLLEAEVAVDLVIARSSAPENGEDAAIEPLIESKIKIEQHAEAEEAIDLHEIYEFLVVEPGQPLVKKIPATKGTDGKDVLGNAIKAKPGVDLQFEKPFQGVEVSEEDDTLLIATLKGHPIVGKYGARVDPVMTLEAVDIHSGNIEYDGSLLIKKDVESGFEINITGDLMVKGSIYQASVQAGGNVEVNGGINADDMDDEHSCHLQVGGNLTAKFLHHADIRCQGDINAHEYIMQCRLTAEGFINAGQSRGRGCIIGGHCVSNSGVNAKVLGSDAYVTTTVCLGSDSELHKQLNEINQQLKRRTHEEEQLTRILEQVRGTGEPTNLGQTTIDKARKIENTILVLRVKIGELRKKLAELKPRVKISDNLVVNSGKIFPNVVISINGHPWSCEETRSRTQVKLDGKKLIVGAPES